jgi:hypothetical protein
MHSYFDEWNSLLIQWLIPTSTTTNEHMQNRPQHFTRVAVLIKQSQWNSPFTQPLKLKTRFGKSNHKLIVYFFVYLHLLTFNKLFITVAVVGHVTVDNCNCTLLYCDSLPKNILSIWRNFIKKRLKLSKLNYLELFLGKCQTKNCNPQLCN